MSFLKNWIALLGLTLFFIPLHNWADIDFSFEDDYEDAPLQANLPTRAGDYRDSLETVALLGLNTVLAKNFFKRTNSLNKRPLHTLPSFWFLPYEQANQNWTLNLYFFYNQTSKLFLAADGNGLGDYLHLQNDFLEDLDEDLFKDALPDLGLIAPGKIQDRQTGLMLQFFKQWTHYSLEGTLPILYAERNYFFTPDEEAAIRDEFNTSGGSDNLNSEMLALAVSDKLGLGDLHLKLRFPVYKVPKLDINSGLQVTIPIALAIKKGLIGSYFPDLAARPTINIKQLLNLQEEGNDHPDKLDEAQALVKSTLVKTLNRLSEALLETPLGNNGHWSLGLFLEPQIQVNDATSLMANFSLEYLLPADETRFYIKTKNPADFTDDTLDVATEDEEIAEASIKFLNQAIINTIYLDAYKAKIYPGLMAQMTIATQFTIKAWKLKIGYDFWAKQKEEIDLISILDSTQRATINSSLNQPFKAIQNKFFAKFGYQKLKKNYDWTVSLSGDKTLASSGIGQDFNITLGFEVNY